MKLTFGGASLPGGKTAEKPPDFENAVRECLLACCFVLSEYRNAESKINHGASDNSISSQSLPFILVSMRSIPPMDGEKLAHTLKLNF